MMDLEGCLKDCLVAKDSGELSTWNEGILVGIEAHFIEKDQPSLGRPRDCCEAYMAAGMPHVPAAGVAIHWTNLRSVGEEEWRIVENNLINTPTVVVHEEKVV